MSRTVTMPDPPCSALLTALLCIEPAVLEHRRQARCAQPFLSLAEWSLTDCVGTEYRNKVLTRLAFNNPRWGCYALAVTIFSLGILRDHLYQRALADQPKSAFLHYTEFKLLAVALFAIGGTLVITSMWALGVTGTYLGDYFVSLTSNSAVPGCCRGRRAGLASLPFRCRV